MLSSYLVLLLSLSDLQVLHLVNMLSNGTYLIRLLYYGDEIGHYM